MQFLRSIGVATTLSLLSMASAVAEDGGEAGNAQAVITRELTAAMPQVVIRRISESPIPGVYEVESNIPKLLYVSGDGKYFVAGDIYEISDGRITNPAQERLERRRAEVVNTLDPADMVVFRPEKVRAVVTVFTDVDCGYCRKLHNEVPQLNRMGIQVNYLAYPRAGVGSGTYNKMVSVWCAPDRQDAMTRAKRGEALPSANCENPVSRDFELGNELGINGTPAIILTDGRLIPGYMPAADLAAQLGMTDE